MKFRASLSLALIRPVLLILLPVMSNAQSLDDHRVFSLSETCPPGFELTTDNRCLLRSIYQLYTSIRNQAVGGMRTPLPDYRDGFSPQQIDLGRYLFFDPILSGDQTRSCATCHQPDKGFADGLGRSPGTDGHPLPRGAPSLWNVAFNKRLFWDARAESLEQQMLEPLFAKQEMGNTPEQLLAELNQNKTYRQLFAVAFPEQNLEEPGIQLEMVYSAIAGFQSSLISLNSRYDHYVHGDHSALNQREIEGLNVFRSFVARCAECHTPPLFTNQQIAVIGTPEPEGLDFDIGAEKTFNSAILKGGFKVPSLRNIERSAPYMHSGRFSTLREAVAFYNGGRGHAVPDGLELQLHWHIWEPNLAEPELDLLVDFLKTLTDERFMPVLPKQLPSGLKPDVTAAVLSTR